MLYANIFINLLAAVGLLTVGAGLRRSPTPNIIATRLIWLIVFAASLFIARALFWGTGFGLLGRLELMIAAVLPLLLVIVTEGVLRRHAPFAIKLSVVGLAGLLIFMSIFSYSVIDPIRAYIMAAGQMLSLVFCIGWLTFRNRGDRTRSENLTADIFLGLLILAGTLILTDYSSITNFPVKLGALGLLMSAYVLVSTIAPGFSVRKILTESALIVFVTFMLTSLATTTLGVSDANAILRLIGTCLTLFLTAIILVRYFGIRLSAQRSVAPLLNAPTAELEPFLEASLDTDLMQETKIISSDSLGEYDLDQIEDYLVNIGVFSVDGLEKTFQTEAYQSAAEQLSVMLDKYNASHITLVARQPAKFLVTSIPAFVHGENTTNYLSMLNKIALLIPNTKLRETVS